MTVKVIACPTCGEAVRWERASRFRPFCSQRCQLIDFGEWAAERHRVPGDPEYDDVTESDSGTAKPRAVD